MIRFIPLSSSIYTDSTKQPAHQKHRLLYVETHIIFGYIKWDWQTKSAECKKNAL